MRIQAMFETSLAFIGRSLLFRTLFSFSLVFPLVRIPVLLVTGLTGVIHAAARIGKSVGILRIYGLNCDHNGILHRMRELYPGLAILIDERFDLLWCEFHLWILRLVPRLCDFSPRNQNEIHSL